MIAEWLLNGELHGFYHLLLLMMWSNFLYHLSWSGLDYFILVHCFGQVATRWRQKTAKTDNKNSVEIWNTGLIQGAIWSLKRFSHLGPRHWGLSWLIADGWSKNFVHFSKRMRLESWCKTQEIIAIGKCRILPESSSPGFGPVFQMSYPFMSSGEFKQGSRMAHPFGWWLSSWKAMVVWNRVTIDGKPMTCKEYWTVSQTSDNSTC